LVRVQPRIVNQSIKKNFLHRSEVFGFAIGVRITGEQYCTAARMKRCAEFDWALQQRASVGQGGNTMRPPTVLSASSICSDRVWNNSGEELGAIEELMIDVDTGQIAYAVLSFGGFLGFGDKLFAIPWNALKLDAANKVFKLNIERKVLKSAPGFDKDNWPDMADSAWGYEIYQHYGYEPYWDRGKSTRM
jgi:sporulation protein YlmC with PRC-barrel domain